MPPDRVGVVRTLKLGHTLKRVGRGYDLDLSMPGLHKTRYAMCARWYLWMGDTPLTHSPYVLAAQASARAGLR